MRLSQTAAQGPGLGDRTELMIDISVVVGVIGDQESGEQDGLALHTR